MTINGDALPIELAKGNNVALRDLDEELGSVTAVLETTGTDGQPIDADVSVLLLNAEGKVRSNDDFVFYNQPVALSGAIHLRDKIRSDDDDQPVSTDMVTVELDGVPDDIQRIVLCASLDQSLSQTFGDAAAVRLKIRKSDDATELLVFTASDASSETGWIFGEFYRRQEEWKFRAVGQGFDDGLAQLALEFGVEIDQPDGALTADDAQGPTVETSGPGEFIDEQVDDSTSPAPAGRGSQPAGTTMSSTDSPATNPGFDSTDESTTTVSVRRPVRPPKLPSDWNSTVPTDSDTDWQTARLFPVAGIGGAEEQERRATSALLAVMRLVKEFGRSIMKKFGAPSGAVETFIEVPFGLDDQAYRPDGVVRVTRGKRVWTTLVEVKTSDAKLTDAQVDKYVDIARDKGIDAVLTISNQLTGSSDDHPVTIDKRKLRKVSLHHLSWDEIRTEATLLAKYERVSDPTQQRVLEEFLRYMTHARSGLHGFTNMGPQWVKVRDAVRAQTLRSTDKGCADVTSQFDQLIQRVSLDMSGLLGVETAAMAPRNRSDSATRQQQLADSGLLFGSIKIPGAVDRIVVEADLRTEHVTCSVRIDAPREGRAQTRVNWLLRQIPEARDGLRIEAVLTGGRGQTTVGLLGAIRKRPDLLIPTDTREIRAFKISFETNMGSKRSGSKDGLITSVETSVIRFYGEVVQNLRSWNSRAPQLGSSGGN
ncbi:TerD family protein [Nakamurella lactea]|uniref:TerD family protein n=1 Tax=Nakamurella lactea TaxID=459515 RepID=UPI0004248ECD|nr:TerD family protein [Nakamurella lactea]